jgi:hypothetical protein
VKNKAEGYGKHIWSNGKRLFFIKLGDQYDGNWLNCLKHGEGHDIFSNGD